LVPTFHSLSREFEGRAKFLGVYITEAHAADEWPINSGRFNGPGNSIDQPKTTVSLLLRPSRILVRRSGFRFKSNRFGNLFVS
jgi:hypothetical protein